MLRSKQLGTLSQSAKAFLFCGSRCSAGDGSSCTCTEDETCLSKRPQTQRKNQLHKLHISPNVISRPSSVSSASIISSDPAKAVQKVEITPAPHTPHTPNVVHKSGLIEGSESTNYSVYNEGNNETSPHTGDQFVKAGIAAVNYLSDFVNYRIPSSDHSNMNYMVNPKKPITNIRPSNIKASRKGEIVHQNSFFEPGSGSNLPTKSQTERPIPVKGHIPNNHVSKSREYQDKRRPMPQRYKGPSNVRSGFAPIVRPYQNSAQVVEKVSLILQQLRWGGPTVEALTKLNYKLDAYQANQVLKQLRDYNVALGFFYWLKNQPGFKHDGHTYTTMVGILGNSRQFNIINKLLDQMVNDNCKPNVVTYNRIIHSYGRANYLKDALNVFHQMQKDGCAPDRVTYCTLIDIHAKSGYLDVAMEMYQRMQEAGLSPDTFTYSVIINCLGKAGHLIAAHNLFTEMVKQGCKPNLVTYNIMIALQAKARNYNSALELYRDMQNAGFEPDKVTYSIVMEVLGHCGYLEEAEAVFTEMKDRNWVPDEPVYGLLVDLWGKSGNVEKAREWYQAMLNAGLCPNVPTCNSLLSAFLRVHRLNEAYNLLQGMIRLGLNPSLQTYTLLLSCCTEAQNSVDMAFCGELMAVTRHPAHTFLLTMPPCGPDGQNVRDHASNFFNLMHSEDRESKRGLVDAVVDFLHKAGLKEEAGSVWEVAALKNVYPDTVKEKSSCYWLINLHVMSDGTAVTALSRTLAWFRKKMIESGRCVSRIDIVTGWGRRSRVTGASLVRESVMDLLNAFEFPFFVENGNSGCFVGCGESLNRWLCHSYVERMHLL